MGEMSLVGGIMGSGGSTSGPGSASDGEISAAAEGSGTSPSNVSSDGTLVLVGEESYSNFLFYYNSHLSGDSTTWQANTFALAECFSDAKKELAFTPINRMVMVYDVYALQKIVGYKDITFGAGVHERITAASLGVSTETFDAILNQLIEYSEEDDERISDIGLYESTPLFTGGATSFTAASFILSDPITIPGPVYGQATTYQINVEKSTMSYFISADSGGDFELNIPPGAIGIIGTRTGDIGEEETAEIYYDSNHIHEAVYTNNSEDLTFLYAPFGTLYTENAFSSLGHARPFHIISSGELSTAKLVIGTPEEEREYISQVLGHEDAGTTYDSMTELIETTITNISSRIYGTQVVDRYAYGRTPAQNLDVDEIREFSDIEASNPTEMTITSAITASSSETSGY